MPNYEKLDPFILAKHFTTESRDAEWEFPPDWMVIYNETLKTFQVAIPNETTGFNWESIGSYIQTRNDGDVVVWNETDKNFEAVPIPTLHDAFVEDGYLGSVPWIYSTITEAVTANAISVAVKDAGDTSSLTVDGTMSLQRLQGKDADTTTLPMDTIISKNDTIIEQLALVTKKLTLSGSRNAAHDMLISGSGQVEFSGALNAMYLSRCTGNTVPPVRIVAGAAGVLLERVFFLSGTPEQSILGNGEMTQVEIRGCVFNAPVSIAFWTNNILGTGLTQSAFKGCQALTAAVAHGFDIYGSQNTIEDCTFIGSRGTLGIERQILLNSGVGIQIETRVVNNNFIASDGSHILFECVSADSDGEGLVFANNVAPNGGTFRGHQDMMWFGNDLRDCTVDLLDKSGQIIIGGDMTNVTLDNIPSDLIVVGVKGQPNRGDWRHASGKIAMDDNVKILFGSGEDASIYYDGNQLIIRTPTGFTRTQHEGHFIPYVVTGPGNYDLGISAARWRSLWLKGSLSVAGASNTMGQLTLSGNLLTNLTNVWNLGSAGTRFKHLYLTGDILVDGTVDGVNISDRDHAATHNIDDAVHNTAATGPELDELTDGSTTVLHDHSGGTGHTIRDDGADQTARTGLNFIGPALVVTDDSVGDEQEISILQSAISHDSIGGVSTDDHHAQSHTAASHSDQGATGTELETLTDGSDASSLHGHGNYTVSEFWEATKHVDAASGGDNVVGYIEMTDTEKTRVAGHLPDYWVSTTSVELILYPDATETIQADITISSIAPGEDSVADATNNDETKSVTAAQLTEWDITSLMPTQAAGDYVFIRVDSDTANIRLSGVKIVYVRSP